MGLKIEISSNLEIVNFLAVTLNLNDNSYKPFNKTNTILTYINVSSNHSTPIIKQVPNVINIKINRLSSSKNIYNFIMEPYITAAIKMNLSTQKPKDITIIGTIV